MIDNNKMKIITVYLNPSDFPGRTVSREFTIEKGVIVDSKIIVNVKFGNECFHKTRKIIRRKYPYMVFFPRDKEDDKSILGSFL